MVAELLRGKGDTKPVSKNWLLIFLRWHLKLKSGFTTSQDRNRQLSEDYDIISYWFKVYRQTVKDHNIKPKDTYDADEKGAIIGVTAKQQCIVSKSEKRPKSSQDKSQE